MTDPSLNQATRVLRAMQLLDDALEALGAAAERCEDDEAQDEFDAINMQRDLLLREVRDAGREHTPAA